MHTKRNEHHEWFHEVKEKRGMRKEGSTCSVPVVPSKYKKNVDVRNESKSMCTGPAEAAPGGRKCGKAIRRDREQSKFLAYSRMGEKPGFEKTRRESARTNHQGRT